MKLQILTLVLCVSCALSGIRAASTTEKTISATEAAKLLVYAPRPDYPATARQKELTGRAVVLVRVSTAGSVLSATLRHSSGWPILDDATVAAAKRLRFRGGKSFAYEQTVTYSKNRASY